MRNETDFVMKAGPLVKRERQQTSYLALFPEQNGRTKIMLEQKFRTGCTVHIKLMIWPPFASIETGAIRSSDTWQEYEQGFYPRRLALASLAWLTIDNPLSKAGWAFSASRASN